MRASPARSPRAARARGRAPTSAANERGVGVDPVTSWPRPPGAAPPARCRSRGRAAGPGAARRRAASQSVEVDRVRRALHVVPDHRVVERARLMRTTVSASPRPDSSSAQLQQRGVGGQRVERAAVAARHRGVERRAQVALHDDRRLHAGVLEPQRHLLGARARRTRRAAPGREHLEVGVPDPGDVAPVGDPVVQRDPEVELAVLEHQRAQHLVGARRVLHEQDRQLAPAHRESLHAPEGAARSPPARPRTSARERRPARAPRRWRPARCRRCRGRGAGRLSSIWPAGRARSRTSEPDMPWSVTRLGRHLRARAARGRSSGSGSGRGGRGRRPRRCSSAPQLRQRFESDGVLERLERVGGVLHAEVDDAVAPAPEVGHQRVVGVQDERGAARRARPRARPSGRPAARARRSGRAGRGRGSRAARATGRARVATGASQASSTSKSPIWPGARPASSSAVATPQFMFEPARLCTTAAPERSSTAASIDGGGGLAVGGRHEHRAVARAARPSSRDRARVEPQQHAAGQRGAAGPRRGGGSRPAARGRAASLRRSIRVTITRRQLPLTADRGRQVGDRVAVRVDGERTVRAHLDLGAGQPADGGIVHVGALEHLRQRRAGPAQLRRAPRTRASRPGGRRRARRAGPATSRRRTPSSCRPPPM